MGWLKRPPSIALLINIQRRVTRQCEAHGVTSEKVHERNMLRWPGGSSAKEPSARHPLHPPRSAAAPAGVSPTVAVLWLNLFFLFCQRLRPKALGLAMSTSCETRCSVCRGVNAETGTEWVQGELGWWYPVCPSCWLAVENTISIKVRGHYALQGGDRLRALVAERALLCAEVVHQTSGSEPQRVARRRLN